MTKANEKRIEMMSGKNKNSYEYRAVYELLTNGGKIIRTGYNTGSGRHTKSINKTLDVSMLLDKIGIAHKCSNDAPRCGVCGEYIVLNRAISGQKSEISNYNIGHRAN